MGLDARTLGRGAVARSRGEWHSLCSASHGFRRAAGRINLEAPIPDLCRNLCRGLCRGMGNPTKVATTVATKARTRGARGNRCYTQRLVAPNSLILPAALSARARINSDFPLRGPSQSAGMPRAPDASRLLPRIPPSRSVWSAAHPAALKANRVSKCQNYPSISAFIVPRAIASALREFVPLSKLMAEQIISADGVGGGLFPWPSGLS